MSRSKPEILILQHADWELPGTYAEFLAERGLRGRAVRPYRGEELPPVRDVRAVLAMGGPMSVNDEIGWPWLGREKLFIEAVVAAGVPYLGTCLGAQLLACAVGACVYVGPQPEYGIHPVTTTPAAAGDPVFAGLPDVMDVFQWHGDTFDLPIGAVSLAGSPEYPNQVFRIGRRAYGLQFHLEVSGVLLATWLAVPECRDEARRHLGHDAEEQLGKEVFAAEATLRRSARHVLHRWLDLPG